MIKVTYIFHCGYIFPIDITTYTYRHTINQLIPPLYWFSSAHDTLLPSLHVLLSSNLDTPDTYNIGSPSDILPPWTEGFSSANISSVLLDLIGIPNNETFSQIAAKGTVISGGGSGAITPPYISSPFEAFSIKAQDENTALFWDFTSGSPAVNRDSEACLVFINAFSTEGTDRSGLHDDFSDGLVKNVANKCNNTIVIIHNAGVRLVDQVRIFSNLFTQNPVSYG